MWSGDGRSLFYVSDRNGAENIWTRPAAASGADKALTTFKDGRVLWPSATVDGRTIAFERDFAIWTLDTIVWSGARRCRFARRGAASSPAPERVRQTSQFEDSGALAGQFEGRVHCARRSFFAASVKDGGDATRITSTPAIESQPVWSPDSRRLAYVDPHPPASTSRCADVGAATTTRC
jgi:dipeptidyl aminopeptidase/acylaminoacyl peptidase